MNLITVNLEGAFKTFASNLSWVMNEASDINSAYFATDAASLVSALSSGTSGASLDTKLTKAQMQNFVGFIGQLANFFGNAAVSTGDYLNTIDNVIYGNAAAPAKLSDATESLANRMKILSQSCLTQYLSSKDILGRYYNSQLSVVIAGCSGSMVVYGATMNVTELTQGITLVEQFNKLVSNQSVTTGQYSTNIAVWQSL